MMMLSTTEFHVLHAEQDLRAAGFVPTPKLLARSLPDLHAATVTRTRHRLAGWGVIGGDGVRHRVHAKVRHAEPYAGFEATDAERAEVQAAREAVLCAFVVPRLALFGEISGRLPKARATRLDRIVAARDVAEILAAFEG